ncbi:unnamed protein product [Polarella glacialis]|uniref:RING-type domain-containing protein n=1 Tax=Polarella glacialis TaxID=89957 RepID=A0A813KP32_POLGL|nr:unnamed protein product [Polarella glacialis]
MECPICHDDFTTESGARLPKVFPCGHTLCEACVGQLPVGADHRMLCPSCRTGLLPSEVRTNFRLRDAVANSVSGYVTEAQPPQQHAMMPDGLQALRAPLLTDTTTIAPSAPPPSMQPWQVGPQNMYEQSTDALAAMEVHFPAPIHPDEAAWLQERRRTLREWGWRRERTMHRQPSCLMDQMVSGSGLFPLRLLDDDWFTGRERSMIQQLEHVLEGTGNSHALARDMLAPVVYGIDVRIILDNSGSMQLDMFGNDPPRSSGGYDSAGFNISDSSPSNSWLLEQTLQAAFPAPWFSSISSRAFRPAVGGLSPFGRRWFLARDALRHWKAVYDILGIDPMLYLLNPINGIGSKCSLSSLEAIFARPPQGRTPMTEALYAGLGDHKREAGDPRTNRGNTGDDNLLLLLVITDGEADDMRSFSRVLDEVQNGVHGDVQVCLMGLSLVKSDIEWFEDEECEDTRVRTVEAFEVEQRQIQMKEVVQKEGGYNFLVHTFRVLLTNYFPADYDYEAPLQNFRHRVYITLHGRDRWWGVNNIMYYMVSQLFCSACFIATGGHCAGWCQGHECGKCKKPDLIEGLCGED